LLPNKKGPLLRALVLGSGTRKGAGWGLWNQERRLKGAFLFAAMGHSCNLIEVEEASELL